MSKQHVWDNFRPNLKFLICHQKKRLSVWGLGVGLVIKVTVGFVYVGLVRFPQKVFLNESKLSGGKF